MGRNHALRMLLVAAAFAFVLIGAGPSAGTQAPGPPTRASAQAPNFELSWYSVNDGGKIATSSPSYELGLSVGQAAAGERTSASFELGIGFWYGGAPPQQPCDCDVWCDLNGDLLLNPIDVVRIVNYVYKSQDGRYLISGCPYCAALPGMNYNGDWNCDGFVNPIDVVRYVNYVYKNQTQFPPCDPCACTVYPPVGPGDCPPWP